jgi:flagellar biosynthetic protein FliR
MPIGPDDILATFVIFCRIGACLMLMPGFGSPRLPARFRLLVALAATLALTPVLRGSVLPLLAQADPATLSRLVATETLIGGTIGFMGRCFFAAFEALAVAAGMAIGISSNVGAPINEEEPIAPLAALLMLAATTMIFATDMHWEVLRGLVFSYSTLPAASGFRAEFGLAQTAAALGRSFLVALQLCSPFIVFGLVANFAFGLINKLAPQIPIYFVSMPFSIAGGLLLLMLTARAMLSGFSTVFADWLDHG